MINIYTFQNRCNSKQLIINDSYVNLNTANIESPQIKINIELEFLVDLSSLCVSTYLTHIDPLSELVNFIMTYVICIYIVCQRFCKTFN